jgi:hypothetical protein
MVERVERRMHDVARDKADEVSGLLRTLTSRCGWESLMMASPGQGEQTLGCLRIPCTCLCVSWAHDAHAHPHRMRRNSELASVKAMLADATAYEHDVRLHSSAAAR